MRPPTARRISAFAKIIWSYYRLHHRSMPWRTNISPYFVVVSEIMLQQTQVDRVMKKFPGFIKRFPDWSSLARASTKEVLQEWSGLGYNRRALYLKRIAETITQDGKVRGELPKTYEELRKLPGIGPNTAGSILAFAFNIPHPFIETNIRSVFIHFFFKGSKKKVSDTDITPLVEESLTNKTNRENAREWYYALMDYGSYLKKQTVNPSRKSKHHVKQSAFKGSNRELRSLILKCVMKQKSSRETIEKHFKTYPKLQIKANLIALIKEGFLIEKRSLYSIV